MYYNILVLIFICILFVIQYNSYECVDTQSKQKHICVIQYDDRKLSKKLNNLVALNKLYCEKNNVDYIYLNEKNKTYSPYWMKVFLVKKYIPTYDYVIWLDTDATIVNVKNIETFIEKHIEDKDMLISGDMPPWTSTFNAGVFITKNTWNCKNILDYWSSFYDSKSWKNINGKWNCIDDNCLWAGIKYEQGSFIKYVYPKFKDNIKVISWELLNNPLYIKNKDTIFHFAGTYKDTQDLLNITL